MPGLSGLFDRIKLRLLLRREFDSPMLRRWYARRYNVHVGLYSYGCFDPVRVSAHTRIGRYCSFAPTCCVVDENHPFRAVSTHPFLYETALGVIDGVRPEPEWLIIEDDVWIGNNATILPGCKYIGRGAVIGAGAVVTASVAPYTIVVGNPARKLRDRFSPEVVRAIEATRWWMLDKAGLASFAAAHPGVVFKPTETTLAETRRS